MAAENESVVPKGCSIIYECLRVNITQFEYEYLYL